MNKKTLVAFCGAKGSGKDTGADILKELVKAEYTRVAFADHLKNVCSRVFNIEIKHFFDPVLKETELESYVALTAANIKEVFKEFDIEKYEYDAHVRPHIGRVFDTPRQILQYVGTEVLHPLDKLIHVNYALRKLNDNNINLVTDLRFDQEFDALHGRPDFLPIYVKNTKAEAAAEFDSHASEQGWKRFKDRCILVENEGTIQDYKNEMINKIIKVYLCQNDQ